MTKQEFSKIAKEQKGWNVYSIKAIREKGNKGIVITFYQQLSENTVSTQKSVTYWNETLEECTKYLYN